MDDVKELERLIKKLQTKDGGFTRKDLESLGVSWPPKKGWKRRLLGQIKPNPKVVKRKEKEARLNAKPGKKPKKKKGKKSQVAEKKLTAFYKSFQWRRVRYQVLDKNDGRCECCGRSKHEGIYLCVDHIQPLRYNWKLRLDPDNLQCLCNECNHGKGAQYVRDWRDPDLKKLMGEKI